MHGRRSLPLAAVPQSAPSARAFARATLRDWRVSGEVADRAILMTSELVTNAVRHAGTRVILHLDRAEHLLRVEVDDAAEERPRRRRVDPLAEGGRGLDLVDRLSSTWGVEGRPGGKRVWFELAC